MNRKLSVKVNDINYSLDFILQNNCSVARFGDGEMDIITGNDIPYQNYNEKLAQELKNIISLQSDENLLVCLSDVFENTERYNDFCNDFWKGHLEHYFEQYKKLCVADWYGSTFISRPYIDLLDKSVSKDYFSKLKMLWDKKDILIVEGETSRSGVGNDLFDNAKSIQRIICPSKNAYDKYDEIFKNILNYGKDKLILLMLGPTAKVLAYNLSKNSGYQAVDLGHIDSEYEWFKMGATYKVQLSNKHTAEHNYDENIILDNNSDYDEQIIKNLVKTKEINISFAVNNNYAKYLGATILSILEHNKNVITNVHILHKNLSKKIMTDLQSLAFQKDNFNIYFYNIDFEKFGNIPVRTEQFPIESFFRFLLPEVLSNIDRVIYLDVDILVKGSLLDLYEYNLENHLLGAVIEADIYSYYKWYLDSLEFAEDSYFSSGVLLLDLEKMRLENVTKKLLDLAFSNALNYKFPDQDILNIYFKNNFKKLPITYNYTDKRKLDNQLKDDEVIIEHFNGDIKPWNKLLEIPNYLINSIHEYQNFQKMYNDINDTNLVSVVVPIVSGYNKDYFNECLKTILKQSYKNIEIIIITNFIDGDLQNLIFQYNDNRLKIYVEECNENLLTHNSIKYCSGKYITFVKYDSWLDLSNIEKMIADVENNEAEIAVTSFAIYNVENSEYQFYEEEFKVGNIFNTKTLLEDMYNMRWFEMIRHSGLYGKLYRYELFNDIFIDYYNSDKTLALKLYMTAKKVVISDNKLYVARIYNDNNSEENLRMQFEEYNYLFDMLVIANYSLVQYMIFYKNKLKELAKISLENSYSNLFENIIDKQKEIN